MLYATKKFSLIHQGFSSKKWKKKNLSFGVRKTKEILGKSSTKSNHIRETKLAPKLHRMLYATDLSADSIDAIRYAVNYADQQNAKLIVFHVINQRSITWSKILSTFFNEGQEHKIRQEKVNAAFKCMENLLEIIRKKKLDDQPVHLNKIEHLVVHYGKIAEEIVEKANRWSCELIILGPRRSKLLGRIFLPSISRKVICGTDTPVHLIECLKGGNQ